MAVAVTIVLVSNVVPGNKSGEGAHLIWFAHYAMLVCVHVGREILWARGGSGEVACFCVESTSSCKHCSRVSILRDKRIIHGTLKKRKRGLYLGP